MTMSSWCRGDKDMSRVDVKEMQSKSTDEYMSGKKVIEESCFPGKKGQSIAPFICVYSNRLNRLLLTWFKEEIASTDMIVV